MLAALAGNWWAFLLRGIAAVLFGVAVLFWPRPTPFVFIVLFGSYTLVDGILALVAGIRGSGGGRRWPLLAEGVIGMVAGITFFWPRETVSYETLLVLLYVLAGGRSSPASWRWRWPSRCSGRGRETPRS